ncbi:hypothetical protein HJG60_008695 [Phyllostomus discolor]|uniref:Uncharacterized protein n=1 Tax=Phyllostomus discolor TaxID=89673 RepID=A0A833Z1X0_9CHIR|nr:hypothetical protein HJG60_008695 [Phyllostomus discolor]
MSESESGNESEKENVLSCASGSYISTVWGAGVGRWPRSDSDGLCRQTLKTPTCPRNVSAEHQTTASWELPRGWICRDPGADLCQTLPGTGPGPPLRTGPTVTHTPWLPLLGLGVCRLNQALGRVSERLTAPGDLPPPPQKNLLVQSPEEVSVVPAHPTTTLDPPR